MIQPGAISPYQLRLQKRLKLISLSLAMATIIFALTTLSGWNSFLYTHLSGLAYTSFLNPMTSFGFLLSGTALALITFRPDNRLFNSFTVCVAILLMIVGLGRMAGMFHLFDARLDLLLFPINPGEDEPIRMTYITGIGFVLLSICFLLRMSVIPYRKLLQPVLFIVIAASLFSLIGIIYGVDKNYPASLSFFRMRFSTCTSFLLLSMGILAGEYRTGIMALITSNKAGGRMSRAFLPFVFLFPLLIGIVHRVSQNAGLYNDSLGLALFSLLLMIVFFIITLRSARTNNNIHNWLLQEIEDRKKAEDEADSSNVFVNAIYENIPNMVFVKEGLDLRYKSINKAGEELIGHTRQDLLGKSDHDFFPKEEADFFRSKDKEVLSTNKPVIVEEPITTPQHGVRWLRTKKIAIRDENGTPLYMIGISEDITDLKEKEEQLKKYSEGLEAEISQAIGELHKSEDRYHLMVEEIQDYSILLLDAEGRIMNWNKGAERIQGYKSEEIIGKDFSIFYSKEDQQLKIFEKLLAEAKEKGRSSNEGWRIKKDGSRFWAFVVLTALFDDDKTLIGFSKVTRDLTEVKEAADQKLEYERRFRTTINSLGDNAWEYHVDTDTSIFSDSIESLLGYKAQEFTDTKNLWWDITHPNDRRVLEENDRLYREQLIDHHVSEYRVFHKNGTVKWILDRGVVIDRKPDGSPLRIVGIHADITIRKEAGNLIAENESRFRDLTQNVPGVIYQWIERPDGSFGFTYVSPKLKEYFGIDPSDIDKMPDLLHPDDKERWRLSIEESKKNDTQWFFEGRFLFPDGRILWWRGSSVEALRNEDGIIYNGLLMDITEQKLIEEKIAKDQRRYEAIFNSQYQFMGLTTPDGKLTEVNEAILDFAGVKAADVVGKHCWECDWWKVSPAVQQKLRESTMRAAQGEFIRYETDIISKEGRIATIDFSIKPVFDEKEKIILLISEGRDITERKLLEQKSNEQEEQIRLFVKHTPAAVAMFDDQLRYLVASDKWYRDYGLEGKNIIGESHYEIFPEISDMPEWRAIHDRCLQGAVEMREQDLFPRADGRMEWLRWEIHPWKTSKNKIGGIMMFTETITDRIKAKEQLEMLNKQLMESNRELEQFAYVASHDLQEPLRMVNSFLQLLAKKYNRQLDEKAQQYIDFAVDGSDRMKVLIDDLLKFSRVGTASYERKPVDMSDVVQNVIRIYDQNIRKEKAVINVSRLPVVSGSRTQLEQLFQNLLGNALKYRREEPLVINIGCRNEELRWVFYVSDNGIGIDNKFFEKVFIIFQRLHARNEYSGTGIGLAICKKIIERHGGKIWIDSEPGKGSTFYFSFPKDFQQT